MARLRACLSSSLSVIASALFLLAGFAAPAARAQYTAPIDIPTVGNTGSNQVSAISKNGIVAGTSYSNDGSGYGYIWQNGGVTGFGSFGQYIQVTGVNNSGMVAGTIYNADGTTPPFTWTASGGVQVEQGPQSPVDPVTGDPLTPTSAPTITYINNNGMMTGYGSYQDISGAYIEAVLVWSAPGAAPVIISSGGPVGINDAGQVALDSSDSDGNTIAYLWTQANGLTNIGDLGAGSAYAFGINSSGQIAGAAPSAANGGNTDYFLWTPGAGMQDVGNCSSVCTNIHDLTDAFLNDNGELVIQYEYEIMPPLPFFAYESALWTSSGGFQNLGSFSATGASGFPQDKAVTVNASGQIAGSGSFPNGGQQAEYWAPNNLTTPLALGPGQISFISDNGWAAGTDNNTGYAAVWNLSGNVIGISGPPVITVTTPANNATYSVGQNVATSFTCTSPDGILSCTGQDDQGNIYNNGDPLVTASPDSSATFTVTATSNAGLTSSYTVNYTVSSATQVTGAKMRGYGALAADQVGDLYRFVFNVEDTQGGTQAGRFNLWTVDKNGQPRITNTFDADNINSAMFSVNGFNAGTTKKGLPLADTVTFAGTGEFNDVAGYTFTATATDHGQPGVGNDTLTVTVTDSGNNVVFSTMGMLDAGDVFSTRLGATPPPIITDGPPRVTQLEATDANGAVFNYDSPTAVDASGNPVPVTCSIASGTELPLGITHGTCVTNVQSSGKGGKNGTGGTGSGKNPNPAPPASGGANGGKGSPPASGSGSAASPGNAAIRFRVHVKDTTPPVISNMPQNINVPATGNSGAVVTYALPTATDTVDPNPTVTCAKESGKTFAITTTTVTCTAKDASGNKSQATFTVTVTDAIPPKITIASPSGSYALNSAVTASYACTDADSGVATCSGPVDNGAAIDTSTAGSYSFTVTSTDNAGNTSTKITNYTVKKK